MGHWGNAATPADGRVPDAVGHQRFVPVCSFRQPDPAGLVRRSRSARLREPSTGSTRRTRRPTTSSVFMDAFSSRDLVTWAKHARILDVANVTWARRARVGAVHRREGRLVLPVLRRQRHSERPASRRHRRRPRSTAAGAVRGPPGQAADRPVPQRRAADRSVRLQGSRQLATTSSTAAGGTATSRS